MVLQDMSLQKIFNMKSNLNYDASFCHNKILHVYLWYTHEHSCLSHHMSSTLFLIGKGILILKEIKVDSSLNMKYVRLN